MGGEVGSGYTPVLSTSCMHKHVPCSLNTNPALFRPTTPSSTRTTTVC